MSESKGNVVHTEVMELEASPAQVREFIMTPERILDYYPDPVGGGILELGRAIYCQGGPGVSILERIEENAGFTMMEDWELAPSGSGTTLTKTWRDVIGAGPDPFPTDRIREGAIHESPLLIQGWNAAAKES